jgi:tetraprenyl-beta-curcumene synthase
LQRAAVRIVTYQDLNHKDTDIAREAFKRWAKRETPPGAEIRWWETAAASGSSLAVFALMAAAAYPTLRPYQVLQLESSYFPWIGSLHTLLDSLIDRDEDEAGGQKSLIDYYASREEAITRLQVLAESAGRQARSLPDGNHHMMILAAMASFYLSAAQATDPWSQPVRQRVLGSLGDYAVLALFVLRAKDVIERVARRAAAS